MTWLCFKYETCATKWQVKIPRDRKAMIICQKLLQISRYLAFPQYGFSKKIQVNANVSMIFRRKATGGTVTQSFCSNND